MMPIDSNLLDAAAGRGPLQASIRLKHMATPIQMRPNVIFGLCYDKSVLHLGCTDHISIIDYKVQRGIHLHQQLSRIASVCLGVDIDGDSAERLRGHGINNIIVSDITAPGIPQITERVWDFLLMAEMLEHVDNPVDFLQNIAANYKKHFRQVIITVPNAFGLTHIDSVIDKGTESVNNDHRYWFTPFTLCKVAHRAGLVLDDLVMCVYENSAELIGTHSAELRNKPILLDTIVLAAHWE